MKSASAAFGRTVTVSRSFNKKSSGGADKKQAAFQERRKQSDETAETKQSDKTAETKSNK